MHTFSNENHGGDFNPSHSGAVFLNGLFYNLGMDGGLGVYDPNNQTWTVLSSRMGEDKLKFEVGQCYLVEWPEGKLLSVFMDRYYDRPRRVFQLGDSMDGWEKVTDFNDGLLFLGRYGSTMASAPVAEWKNTTCLPKFEVESDYVPIHIEWLEYEEHCCEGSMEYTLNSCWVDVSNLDDK